MQRKHLLVPTDMTTMHAAGSWNSRYVANGNIPLAAEQLPISSVCLTTLAEQTQHHKWHVMRSSHLASGTTAATLKPSPSLLLFSGSRDVDGFTGLWVPWYLQVVANKIFAG